jgi:lysophospholipase L1-like esterase
MLVKRLQALLLPFLCAMVLRAEDTKKFTLNEGDRVAFVGNTFTERDQYTGYLETLLTARYFDRNVIFRNYGWSGDNVWGEARNEFGKNPDGFKALEKQIVEFKPTVIFAAYGMSESFDGEPGLSAFVQQYNVLLDMLAKGGARLVLLSPIKHENLGAPLPDPAEHNKNLSIYADAIKKLAESRNAPFVDLIELLGEGDAKAPFTDNGVHLTPHGYWRTALAIEKGLGLSATKLDLDPLKKDASPAREKGEALRAAILKKNEHFFNRFRPQNGPYIFGFRKHEQGKNAVMIPQFDPLVSAQEAEIAKLRVAVAEAAGMKAEGK